MGAFRHIHGAIGADNRSLLCYISVDDTSACVELIISQSCLTLKERFDCVCMLRTCRNLAKEIAAIMQLVLVHRLVYHGAHLS